MVLWEKDNRVITEIAELLRLETNMVTPLLQRMEKQGLIVQQKSAADSRQRIVSLTGEGKRLEDKIKEVPNHLARQIVAGGISTDELMAMIPLMDKFIATMDKRR